MVNLMHNDSFVGIKIHENHNTKLGWRRQLDYIIGNQKIQLNWLSPQGPCEGIWAELSHSEVS